MYWTLPEKHFILHDNSYLYVTVQASGRSGRKIHVKLACKRVFLPDLISEESPMLLVRQSRTRRCPVLNSYIYIKKKVPPQDLS